MVLWAGWLGDGAGSLLEASSACPPPPCPLLPTLPLYAACSNPLPAGRCLALSVHLGAWEHAVLAATDCRCLLLPAARHACPSLAAVRITKYVAQENMEPVESRVVHRALDSYFSSYSVALKRYIPIRKLQACGRRLPVGSACAGGCCLLWGLFCTNNNSGLGVRNRPCVCAVCVAPPLCLLTAPHSPSFSRAV
jgi:hypothetical protein